MVECPVCKKEYKRITASHLTTKTHLMNLEKLGVSQADDPTKVLLKPKPQQKEPEKPSIETKEEPEKSEISDTHVDKATELLDQLKDDIKDKTKIPAKITKEKSDMAADKATELLEQLKQDIKEKPEETESPIIIGEETIEKKEFKPKKAPKTSRKTKKQVTRITLKPDSLPAETKKVEEKDIKIDISLIEKKDTDKGMTGQVIEHHLGGDFTKEEETRLGSLIFKFKDRMTKILDFQVHMSNISEDEINLIEKITVDIKTNLADEKTLVFSRESLSALDDQRVFTVGEEGTAPSEYFSEYESLKISDEYRTQPEMTFTIRYLKIHLKSEKKARMARFKEHCESMFKYRLVTVKLGGFIGRFMENVMAKLVFITFLMSIINFLSNQLGDMGRLVAIVGTGTIVLVTLIVMIRQAILSKRIRDRIREKEGKKTRRK